MIDRNKLNIYRVLNLTNIIQLVGNFTEFKGYFQIESQLFMSQENIFS